MNRATFFDSVRRDLFKGSLTVEQVQGMNAKLDAFLADGWPIAWAAYGMATSYHETGQKMVPVTEKGGVAYFSKYEGRDTLGNTKAGDGYLFRGRGDVQLTGRRNYEKASKLTGVDLVTYPDMALDPIISARIMIDGMAKGWFTGKASRHYLSGSTPDYVGARRIINGTDKAAIIAHYASLFELALRKAGYGVVPRAVEQAAPPEVPWDSKGLEVPANSHGPLAHSNPKGPRPARASWWARLFSRKA